MFGAIDLKLSFLERSPTRGIQDRLGNLRPALERLPAVMRKGPGSVDDQFQRQGTLTPGGRFKAWPATKPFGKDAKFQARGLKRTGSYLAAWRGEGAGAIEIIGNKSVTIGVSAAMFPQEVVFQADKPTAIRVTRKMRGYLGAVKGVHLRRSTQILIVEPRAFRPNPVMVRRARQVVLNYVINARAEEYRAAA